MVRLGSDASTQQLYQKKMRSHISGWVGGSHHCKVVSEKAHVGHALKSHLPAPRSEPATSVVNFVLRHSGLERRGDVERHSPLSALVLPPQRLKYRSCQRQDNQLGQAEGTEATLDEYIQEAGCHSHRYESRAKKDWHEICAGAAERGIFTSIPANAPSMRFGAMVLFREAAGHMIQACTACTWMGSAMPDGKPAGRLHYVSHRAPPQKHREGDQ